MGFTNSFSLDGEDSIAYRNVVLHLSTSSSARHLQDQVMKPLCLKASPIGSYLILLSYSAYSDTFIRDPVIPVNSHPVRLLIMDTADVLSGT